MVSIVHRMEPITLVGAGAFSESDLEDALQIAPTLVAADGGAAHCLSVGKTPEAVFGDMDSLDMVQAAEIPWENMHEITEQETTDFDKALRHVDAPVVVAVGFTGGRIDHELAAYNILARHPDRRCVLIGETDIVCLAPPKINLHVTSGTRVSLFPMGLVTGVSKGLKWPIAGLEFAPDGRIGTSNVATGSVSLQFDTPGMLLILPKTYLTMLVVQLLQTPEGWPAL